MNCQQATQAMHETLDMGRNGRLSAAAQEHLAACPACRRIWAASLRMEACLGEVASNAVPCPSPDFHSRLMTALRQEQGRLQRARRSRRAFSARRLLAAAAVLAIVLCAGAIVNRPSRLGPTPSAPTHIAPPPANPDETSGAFSVNLTQWIGNPKQDLTELANQILDTTRGVIDIESLKQPEQAIAAEATPKL